MSETTVNAQLKRSHAKDANEEIELLLREINIKLNI